MKHRWITHERALLLAAVALLVCSQLPVAAIRPLTSWPNLILATITQPFTSHLHQASLSVVGDERTVQTTESLQDLQRNYDRLLQDNEWLRQELDDARQAIVELTQTRQIIDRTERRLVAATVTEVQGKRDAPVLTIALQANHGVAVGDIVGSGYNLVGRVSDVGRRVAHVAVITRPNQNLLVNLRHEGAAPTDPGVLALIKSDATGRRFTTDEVSVDDPVGVDDLAYLADESWPIEARGFVVGRVTAADPMPRDPELRRLVVVEPLRDFSRVRRVFVVVPIEGNRGE